MPLDLPDGTACFVDSNILYYAMVPTPGPSEHALALLDRAVAGRLSISVSVPVLSDTIHKVMTSEAAQLAGRDRTGIIGYLGKHPEVIPRLVEYPQAMDRLSAIPMNVLPVDDQLLRNAAHLAVQHALLTNDAMIVALMQRHQLTHLVTNDNDFDSVPSLTVIRSGSPANPSLVTATAEQPVKSILKLNKVFQQRRRCSAAADRLYRRSVLAARGPRGAGSGTHRPETLSREYRLTSACRRAI